MLCGVVMSSQDLTCSRQKPKQSQIIGVKLSAIFHSRENLNHIKQLKYFQTKIGSVRCNLFLETLHHRHELISTDFQMSNNYYVNVWLPLCESTE